MKRVLVLGAGLVARPLVQYLLKQPGYHITVASRTVSKAEALIDENPRGFALPLNVNDDDKLQDLISKADLAISLVPYAYHVKIATLCLQAGIPMVTTSYVSPDMAKLDEEAKTKNILLLNELGVDPGIDHMSAMQIIHHVKERGGDIVSFESCTGGLPAPEANDNPFGYKFSWSPRGVLMAGRNPAHYLKDNHEMIIDGDDLFKHRWVKEVQGLGELEIYPNRDSMMYKELYTLDRASTVFRGTFRYPGWCETLEKIVQLGFLDETERPELVGKSFAEVTAMLIERETTMELEPYAAEFLDVAEDSPIMSRLKWLGFFSDSPVHAEPPTLIDILTARMLDKMEYAPGERDMIVMQHDFVARYPNEANENITSVLIDYGIPNGDSAMARTVSLPAAIGARLILEGDINAAGVQIPILPEIYTPILSELSTLGITFREERTRQSD